MNCSSSNIWCTTFKIHLSISVIVFIEYLETSNVVTVFPADDVLTFINTTEFPIVTWLLNIAVTVFLEVFGVVVVNSGASGGVDTVDLVESGVVSEEGVDEFTGGA